MRDEEQWRKAGAGWLAGWLPGRLGLVSHVVEGRRGPPGPTGQGSGAGQLQAGWRGAESA